MMLQTELRYNFNFILCVFLLFCLKSNCQNNTIVYSQENSVLFSNEYRLNEDNKTFEHTYSTDDGQIWYGKGKYFIKSNKITFKFDDNENQRDTIILRYKKDSLIKGNEICIRNIDFKKNKNSQTFCKINNKIYYFNFDGDILINKKTFIDNENLQKLHIKIGNTNIELDILICNLLEIEGIKNIGGIHYESNFIRILKLRDKFIISKDFYDTSTKKKIRFLKKNT